MSIPKNLGQKFRRLLVQTLSILFGLHRKYGVEARLHRDRQKFLPR